MRAHELSCAIGLALALAGCAGPGQYVWVDNLPPEQAAPRDYVIQSGDLVSVRVFQQEAMSTRAKVRSDGRISVPIVGDIDVRGKRPEDVAKELDARLKSYLQVPNVTVSVDETQPV